MGKYAFRLFVAAALSGAMPAFAQQEIALNKPDMSMSVSLMNALAQRHSEREFADRTLSLQELSNLLWAANGINRPDGKRTAPSALNAQPIDVYVCRADGAYRYDAKGGKLVRVTESDLRPAVAGKQAFVLQAPVSLVLVCDVSRYPGGRGDYAQADAAYVSQNICLYCAAAGLACVPRGSMDAEALKKGLGLTDSQTPILNNVVGHRK